MKRLFCVIAVLCMMASLFGLAGAAESKEPPLVDGYYQISTAEQLEWFRLHVRSGNYEANAKLMNDLTFNESVLSEDYQFTGNTRELKCWDGLGSMDLSGKRASYYRGVFDGNGKTIRGLYLSNSWHGFVNTMAEGGVVKNLTLTDVFVNHGAVSAAVVGCNYGTVENCHVTGRVAGEHEIGGVVGANNGTVKGCTFRGVVRSTGDGDETFWGGGTGGIVGTHRNGIVTGCINYGSITSVDYAGGIVGEMSPNYQNDNPIVTNCTNYGTIQSTPGINDDINDEDGAGGIAARGSYSYGNVNYDQKTISNCVNNGSVSGWRYLGGILGGGSVTVSGCTNNAPVTGSLDYVGGILGQGSNAVVESCLNTANVRGNGFVGGVAGSAKQVKNCGNVGNVTGGSSAAGGVAGSCTEVQNCFSMGYVTAQKIVGAIVGQSTSTLSNCYYLPGTVTDGTDQGSAEAAEKLAFASGEICWKLGQAFGQEIGTDAYPIPGGKTVYRYPTAGGYVYSNSDTAPTEHIWLPATCTTPKTCGICGETQGTALGHSWQAADCIAAKTCADCGKTEGTALGHRWLDATCENPKTCTACGETEGKALGHRWVNATCTAAKTCATCAKTEGAALGHSWVAATCEAPKTCTVCEVTEGKALGHSYTPANCTSPELCRNCGGTGAPALGHDWVGGDCTTDRTCATCGLFREAAAGHDWQDATCTAAKVCSICALTEGEALGHQSGDEDTLCDRCGLDLAPPQEPDPTEPQATDPAPTDPTVPAPEPVPEETTGLSMEGVLIIVLAAAVAVLAVILIVVVKKK